MGPQTVTSTRGSDPAEEPLIDIQQPGDLCNSPPDPLTIPSPDVTSTRGSDPAEEPLIDIQQPGALRNSPPDPTAFTNHIQPEDMTRVDVTPANITLDFRPPSTSSKLSQWVSKLVLQCLEGVAVAVPHFMGPILLFLIIFTVIGKMAPTNPTNSSEEMNLTTTASVIGKMAPTNPTNSSEEMNLTTTASGAPYSNADNEIICSGRIMYISKDLLFWDACSQFCESYNTTFPTDLNITASNCPKVTEDYWTSIKNDVTGNPVWPDGTKVTVKIGYTDTDHKCYVCDGNGIFSLACNTYRLCICEKRKQM